MKKKAMILVIILTLLFSGVVSAAPKSPNIIISKYSVDQATITPGGSFTVTLDVENYGEYHARKVKVSLNNEQGQENLGNFSPLNQSNIQYIPLVEAGKTKKVTFNMYVSPKITPGNYNIMVKLSYTDTNGSPYEETQTIGLLVTEKDSVRLYAKEDIGDIMVGEAIESEVQIVNNGLSEVKGISISIVGEETDTPVEFLGNFNSGDYDNYGFTIIGEEPGEKTVKIIAEYTNSLNEAATVEKDITYRVLNQEEGQMGKEGKSEGNWFIKFIKGIFGLS